MDKTSGPVAGTDTEKWLLTLVEKMPQMIWRAVGRGQWTWSSPQWMRYTGQSQAESAGEGWLDAVHSEDREVARSAWQAAPEFGLFHADLRLRSRSGDYKWFQTRGTPISGDNGAIAEWIGTSTDVDDLRRLQSEQRVLVSELQHRTRNLIAVVHSISVQTLQRAASLDDFRERFEDRLAALSRVQGLLSTSEHDPITIGRLIGLELSALAEDRLRDQVSIAGPDVTIRNSSAQTMALAVHELSTNALKYGALSSPEGRLAVNWFEHVEEAAPWLCVEWRESGVTTQRGESRREKGYGRKLIEQALPRQLGARTSMRFGKDRMECMIDLPLKHYQAGDSRG